MTLSQLSSILQTTQQQTMDSVRQLLESALAPRQISAPDVIPPSSTSSSRQLKLPQLPELSGKSTSAIEPWFRRALSHLLAHGVSLESQEAVVWTAAHFSEPLATWWHSFKQTQGDPSFGHLTSFQQLFQSVCSAFHVRPPDVLARERISRLRQTSSVLHYTALFRENLLHLPQRHEQDSIWFYKQGLKTKVRELVSLTPNLQTLDAVIKQALEADQALLENHHSFNRSASSFPRPSSRDTATPMDLGNVTSWADEMDAADAAAYGEDSSAADDDDVASQAELAAIAARSSLPSKIPPSSRRPHHLSAAASSSATRRPPPPKPSSSSSSGPACYVCGQPHRASVCPSRHPMSKKSGN